MKPVLPVLLLVAGAGAAWIAWSTRSPDYAPPNEAPTAYAPAPSELAGQTGPGEVVRRFEVQGMCCTGCTGKLQRALTTLEGVHEAAVDFDSGVASVRVDDGVSGASLAKAMSFGQYHARELP